MEKTSSVKNAYESFVASLQNAPRRVFQNVSGRDVAIVGGASVLAGVLLSHIYSKSREKGSDKAMRNIHMYQSMESPHSDENIRIRESLMGKESALLDIPAMAASAAIPTYIMLAAHKNKKQRGKVDDAKLEVLALRDAVDKAYRRDMLDVYGVKNETELSKLVSDLRKRVGEDAMGKTMEKISISSRLLNRAAKRARKLAKLMPNKTGPDYLKMLGRGVRFSEAAARKGNLDSALLSLPGVMATATGAGILSFLTTKNLFDANDPRRQQKKKYLKQLDRLYRERVATPTIGGLPLSDEELLALEMHRSEKGKRRPKLLEEPEIAPAAEKDMDSDDVKNILASL